MRRSAEGSQIVTAVFHSFDGPHPGMIYCSMVGDHWGPGKMHGMVMGENKKKAIIQESKKPAARQEAAARRTKLDANKLHHLGVPYLSVHR